MHVKKERKQVMKKFLTKTGSLGLPQKGHKQVANLQHNALTSLIHFVQFTQQSELGMQVH